MFKFAQRILASTEVDAVTYKQFLEWDEKEKRQYLEDHPNSKFGHQHEQGLTETKPYSQIRKERAEQRQPRTELKPEDSPNLKENEGEQKPAEAPKSKGKELQNPFSSSGTSTEPLAQFKKDLRKPGTSYKSGSWKPEEGYANRGRYSTPDGDTVSFFNSTTYVKEKGNSRLRNPAKTRYETWAYLNVKDPANPERSETISIPFAVAIGEGQASREKQDAGKAKAQRFAKQKFGIDLGDYDFRH